MRAPSSAAVCASPAIIALVPELNAGARGIRVLNGLSGE